MSRVCLRFELPIENTNSISHIFRSYRRHRWTSYFCGSVYQCSVGGHEKKVYITDGVLIYPSVRAEKNSSLTVNCLYHRYRRYRWTRFSRATSCPWNNVNYLFHQRIDTLTDCVFISLSVRTDNRPLPTVNCLYHRYRRCRWTRFPRATSCPWNNANYLFHQRILHIHRWRIHFSIGTDGQPRFTDGKLPLPSVPLVPMDKVFEGYLMPLD